MKMSAHKHSPYYHSDCMDYSVYLDGVNISHVFFIDDEEGYVERYKTDENGNIITKNGQVFSEKLYGNVEIKRNL